LGVAEVLLKNGLEPDLISSSSTGTIVGVLLAARIQPEEICRKLFSPGFRLGWWVPSLRPGGIWSQRNMARLLEHFRVPERLEDLPIPIHVVLTDLVNGCEICVSRGDTLRAALASAALPGIYAPLRHAGTLCGDGGIINNVPADICRRLVGDSGVVLSSSLEMNTTLPDEFLRTTIQVAYRSIYLPLLNRRYSNFLRNSDIVIQPFSDHPLCFSRWREILKFHSRSLMADLFDRGRVHMERELPLLLALLADRNSTGGSSVSQKALDDDAGVKGEGGD